MFMTFTAKYKDKKEYKNDFDNKQTIPKNEFMTKEELDKMLKDQTIIKS